MNLCTCIIVEQNLSIKDTLNKEHLSNEGTVCSPNHIEVGIYLRSSELGRPLYTGHPTELVPNGVLYREFHGIDYCKSIAWKQIVATETTCE